MRRKKDDRDDQIAELQQKVKTLENKLDEDIFRFKRIIGIRPIKYLKSPTQKHNLAILRAFEESQKIARERLEKLGIVNEQVS